MLMSDLCLGVLVGVLAAGVLGFVLQRILWTRSRVRAFFQPQAIVQRTGRTPAQAFVGCLEGVLGLLFLLLFIALVVLLVNYFYY